MMVTEFDFRPALSAGYNPQNILDLLETLIVSMAEVSDPVTKH